MTTANESSVRDAVEALFESFKGHRFVGENFCRHCYSDKEIQEITQTPLRELNIDLSRMLLWEPANHWESSTVYRHYLPRLLQVLTSPEVGDLYPGHVFEVLEGLGFDTWYPDEREAVLSFFAAVLPSLTANEGKEWNDSFTAFRARVGTN
jgi:hypothetical protein